MSSLAKTIGRVGLVSTNARPIAKVRPKISDGKTQQFVPIAKRQVVPIVAPPVRPTEKTTLVEQLHQSNFIPLEVGKRATFITNIHVALQFTELTLIAYKNWQQDNTKRQFFDIAKSAFSLRVCDFVSREANTLDERFKEVSSRIDEAAKLIPDGLSSAKSYVTDYSNLLFSLASMDIQGKMKDSCKNFWASVATKIANDKKGIVQVDDGVNLDREFIIVHFGIGLLKLLDELSQSGSAEYFASMGLVNALRAGISPTDGTWEDYTEVIDRLTKTAIPVANAANFWISTQRPKFVASKSLPKEEQDALQTLYEKLSDSDGRIEKKMSRLVKSAMKMTYRTEVIKVTYDIIKVYQQHLQKGTDPSDDTKAIIDGLPKDFPDLTNIVEVLNLIVSETKDNTKALEAIDVLKSQTDEEKKELKFKIDALSGVIADYDKDLSASAQKIKSIEQERKRLEQLVEELRASLDQEKQIAARERAEFDKLKEEHQDYSKSAPELAEKNLKLTEELFALQERLSKLSKDNQELAEYVNENEEAKLSLEVKEEEINSQRLIIADLEGKAQKLYEQVQKLERRAEDGQKKSRENLLLTGKVMDLERKIGVLERELGSGTDEIEKLTKTHSKQIADKLAEKDAIIAEKDAAIDDIEKQLEEEWSRLTDAKDKISKYEALMATVKSVAPLVGAPISDQPDVMLSGFINKIKELVQKLNEQLEKSAAADTNIRDLNEEIAKLRQESQTSTATFFDLQEDYEQALARIRELETQVANHQPSDNTSNLDAITEEKAQLDEQVKLLQSQMEAERTKSAQLNKTLEKAQEDIDNLKRDSAFKLSAAIADKTVAEEALTKEKRRVKTIQAKLTEAESEAIPLKSAIQNAISRLQQVGNWDFPEETIFSPDYDPVTGTGGAQKTEYNGFDVAGAIGRSMLDINRILAGIILESKDNDIPQFPETATTTGLQILNQLHMLKPICVYIESMLKMLLEIDKRPYDNVHREVFWTIGVYIVASCFPDLYFTNFRDDGVEVAKQKAIRIEMDAVVLISAINANHRVDMSTFAKRDKPIMREAKRCAHLIERAMPVVKGQLPGNADGLTFVSAGPEVLEVLADLLTQAQ